MRIMYRIECWTGDTNHALHNGKVVKLQNVDIRTGLCLLHPQDGNQPAIRRIYPPLCATSLPNLLALLVLQLAVLSSASAHNWEVASDLSLHLGAARSSHTFSRASLPCYLSNIFARNGRRSLALLFGPQICVHCSAPVHSWHRAK